VVFSVKLVSSIFSTVGNSGKKPATNDPSTALYIFSAVATSSTRTGEPSE
jgi:hypothetical protein